MSDSNHNDNKDLAETAIEYAKAGQKEQSDLILEITRETVSRVYDGSSRLQASSLRIERKCYQILRSQKLKTWPAR